MSNTPLDPRSEATRTALLKAAGEVFASVGFKAARTSDIAAAADTPISAINYHFGGKRGLYDATLLALAQQRIAQHPMPGALPSAEVRLRLTVKTFLNRLLNQDDTSLVVRLMMNEIKDGGPALNLLADNVIKPQASIVMGVLRELLSDKISDTELQRFFLSFFGQCSVYLFAKPMLDKIFPNLYSTLDRDALAQHIADVMLAAIHARKAQA